MILKILLSHLAIFIVVFFSIWTMSVYNLLNEYTCFTTFIVSLILYIFSGFLIAKKGTRNYIYFFIAFIGLIFWTIAYIKSPNSLNYKTHPEAGFWMYYRFYIIGLEMPLNYIETFNFSEKYSIKFHMYFLLFLSILASLLQYIGMKIKLRFIHQKYLEKNM